MFNVNKTSYLSQATGLEMSFQCCHIICDYFETNVVRKNKKQTKENKELNIGGNNYESYAADNLWIYLFLCDK